MILLERHGCRAALPRVALGTLQAVRRAVWRVTKPRTTGNRAICLTEDGSLILVRHSYAHGWFLPGGGARTGEGGAGAVLRELREEIGVVAHAHPSELFVLEHRANHKHDRQTVWIVRNVRLRPRLSLEIEVIGLFRPDILPVDVHPSTQYRIGRWLGEGRGDGRDWISVAIPPED